MARFVIAVYKPKDGKDAQLASAVKTHMKVLREQGLVTDREAYVMRAADGTLIEVFEWRSADAVRQAHENPAVQALWEQFGDACEYVPLASVAEAQQMFAEFESVEL